MAEWPERAVGKAVVVAALLLLVLEPEPAQGVAPLAVRDRDAAGRIGDLPIGVADGLGDPAAAAGPHHRIERGDEPASRGPGNEAACLAVVHVGFAVGHYDEAPPVQPVAQGPAEVVRFRRGGSPRQQTLHAAAIRSTERGLSVSRVPV